MIAGKKLREQAVERTRREMEDPFKTWGRVPGQDRLYARARISEGGLKVLAEQRIQILQGIE